MSLEQLLMPYPFDNKAQATDTLLRLGLGRGIDANEAPLLPGILVSFKDTKEVMISQEDGTFGHLTNVPPQIASWMSSHLSETDHIRLGVDNDGQVRAYLKEGYNVPYLQILNDVDAMIEAARIPPNDHDPYIGEWDPNGGEDAPEEGRWVITKDWEGFGPIDVLGAHSYEVSGGVLTRAWLENDNVNLSTYTPWDASTPLPDEDGIYVASHEAAIGGAVEFVEGDNVTFLGGKLTTFGSAPDPANPPSESWDPTSGIPSDGTYRVALDEVVELRARPLIRQATIATFDAGQVIEVDHPTEYGHRSARHMFDDNGNGVFDADSGDIQVQPVFANFTANGMEWEELTDPRDLMTRSEIESQFETIERVALMLAENLAQSKPMIGDKFPVAYPNGLSQPPVQKVRAPYDNMFFMGGPTGFKSQFWTEEGGDNTFWERP
ncbi:MAG: hypothetical protein ACPGWR_00915 [Ardenticatenaceae bacterium]